MESKKMRPWKTLARKTLLDMGPFLKVELHRVRLPKGQTISDWSWVIMPEYATILVETTEGRFLCFRQTKYGVKGTSLAVPGGFIEPGESPAAAARRELLEETGYAARRWVSLGSFVVDPNRGAGRGHFFLARHARQVAMPTGGDLEHQQPVFLTRTQLERALAHGEFQALAWGMTVSLGLARHRALSA